MLEIRNLEVCYGSISALQGISAKVERGNIVTLVGANGAGKTTTLRTISGVVKAKSGTITFDGEDITNTPPHKIVARGIAQCPEGRMVFANLSVMENLRWAPTSAATRRVSPRTLNTFSGSSRASTNAKSRPLER
jgi:branched-chain amino acid transport system ATP-binding protein